MSSALQCELKSDPMEVEKCVFTWPKFPEVPFFKTPGQKAVISAWDTNIYIEAESAIATEPLDWVITDQFGPELEEGREYLLICPKY